MTYINATPKKSVWIPPKNKRTKVDAVKETKLSSTTEFGSKRSRDRSNPNDGQGIVSLGLPRYDCHSLPTDIQTRIPLILYMEDGVP